MPYQTVTSLPMSTGPYPSHSSDREASLRRRRYPAGATLGNWQAPDGWRLRTITVPPRLRPGTIARGKLLFLSGRADPFEKYVESLDHWAERGWQVQSFDWRGQGGSGRFPDGPVDDVALRIRDLAAYVALWREKDGASGPHVVIAHSMGGFLVLAALVAGEIELDAAALVAPMLGLNSRPLPTAIAHALARTMVRLGLGDRRMWARDDRDVGPSARQRRLTHDLQRYADRSWWRQEIPDLSFDAPTWRWVSGAYLATETLAASPALETMRVPTLLLASSLDRLVSVEAVRRVAARLPDARLHVYGPDVAHEILREVDAIRDDALARIDAFLDERAPARG